LYIDKNDTTIVMMRQLYHQRDLTTIL